MTHMQRRQTIAAVVVTITSLGWYAATHRAVVASDHSAPASPHIPTVVARPAVFLRSVEAHGTIGTASDLPSKLAFGQPGIVAEVTVHVGETVQPGQVLAQLRLEALSSAVRQAQAETAAANTIATAKAKQHLAAQKVQAYANQSEGSASDQIASQSMYRQFSVKVVADRAQLDRSQKLYAGGVIAAKDVQAASDQVRTDEVELHAARAKQILARTERKTSLMSARTDVLVAQNDVSVAQAQVEAAHAKTYAAQVAYSNGTLYAQRLGVITAVHVRPGEAVDASTPVVECAAFGVNATTLNIPVDLGRKLHVGDQVAAHLSDGTGPTVSGVIVHIVPAIDATSQTLPVVVRITLPQAVAGDLVDAKITTHRETGIVLPMSAIIEDPQTGKTVVFVQQTRPSLGTSGFEEREIHISASDDQHALVRSGIVNGERIVRDGAYTLLAPNGG